MDKYRILKTMGDGTFGVVFKAVDKNQEIVAIKKMKAKYTQLDQCTSLRQVKSLSKLDHPNIIKLREVILSNSELYLVFDFLETNLYQVYTRAQQSNRTLTQSQIKSIFYQMVDGIGYLHRNGGFFHRDLKPQNILCHNNVVKICDFGLARQIRSRPPFTQYVSTRWYRAPQLLLRSTSYNSPVDIFALACIIIELYMMAPIFPGANQIQTLNKIVDLLGTPKKSEWPEGYKLASSMNYNFPQKKKKELVDLLPNASLEAVDLLQSMLNYSPRKRPTASQIMKHPFFQNYHPQLVQSKHNETKFSFYERNIIEIPQNIRIQNPKDMEMRRSQIKFGGSFTSSFHLTKDKFKEQQLEKKEKNLNNLQSKIQENLLTQKKQKKKEVVNKNLAAMHEEDLINKKFDEMEEILQELQMKENQKKMTATKSQQPQYNKPTSQYSKISQFGNTADYSKINEYPKQQFSSSAKQQLRMPMFSLGSLSSMTSNKILKTPVIRNSKQV